MSVASLPYITVQHDLAAVEADVADGTVARESAWVSIYLEGESSVHGSMLVERDERDRLSHKSQGDVQVSSVTSTEMVIGCSKLAVPPTRVRRPKQTLRNLHKGAITAFDVSPTDNQSLATGAGNGVLRFSSWSGSPAQAVDARGVLGDVTDIRFFPSGEVALVSSTDMITRVFGASGSNPRSLKGHTRSVEACLPLPPKGRLVMTASKDQTAKIWRVADETCLHSFRLGSGGNAIAIGKRPPGFEGGLRPPDGDDAAPQQVDEDTALDSDLIALVALANGSIAVLDIAARSAICNLSTSSTSPALCVAYDTATGLLASGHLDGTVIVQHLGYPDSIQAKFRRGTRAAVHSLGFSTPWTGSTLPSLLIAGADGLPYRIALNEKGDEGVQVSVVEEFMGLDTDSICSLREVHGSVFAASNEGSVRRW